jgi:hypothetical protein
MKEHRRVVGTPQQNGVAERMNRTLLEKARCMLSNAGLGKEGRSQPLSLLVGINPSRWREVTKGSDARKEITIHGCRRLVFYLQQLVRVKHWRWRYVLGSVQVSSP